jgi:hypothetical protein
MPSRFPDPGNPALLSAMETATASGDVHDRRAVCTALAASIPVLPLRSAEPGAEAELLVLVDRDGSPLLPAFTDLDALAAWTQGDVAWTALPGVELCALGLERGAAGIVLNPAGPFPGKLDRRELQLVVDSDSLEAAGPTGSCVERLVVRDPEAFTLRLPTRPVPDHVAAGVRRALAGRPEVVAGYLLERQTRAGVQLVLAVVPAADADWPRLAPELGTTISRALAPDEFIDLIRPEGDLLAFLREHATPLAAAPDA